MTWIYEYTPGNKARFVLGEPGENNLICFGINPSTAEPDNLDPTLTRVKNIAAQFGYDGWIMLNVYPQRATDPNDMDDVFNESYHCDNLHHISEVLQWHQGIVWAAWGTLIEKRPYLKKCLKDIVDIAEPYAVDWKTRGQRSKAGHPHHPLYLRYDFDFDEFDIDSYVKGLK